MKSCHLGCASASGGAFFLCRRVVLPDRFCTERDRVVFSRCVLWGRSRLTGRACCKAGRAVVRSRANLAASARSSGSTSEDRSSSKDDSFCLSASSSSASDSFCAFAPSASSSSDSIVAVASPFALGLGVARDDAILQHPVDQCLLCAGHSEIGPIKMKA